MPIPNRTQCVAALTLFSAIHSSFVLGQFAPARSIRVHECHSGPDDFPNTAIYADLNGDGHDDIIRKSDAISQQPVWQRWIPGGFAPPQPLGEPIPWLYYLFSGDMDGNGWVDVCFPTSHGFEIVLNSGYGVFDEIHVVAEGEVQWEYPGVADLNGDGTLDIFAWNSAGYSIHLNQGNATFGPPIATALDGFNIPQFALDMDGDGDQDLVSEFPAFWFANDGAGNFGAVQVLDQVTGTQEVEYRDLTNDGLVDVLYGGDFAVEIYMLENTGGGTFSSTPQLLSGTAEAYAFSLGETDIDGDGDPDLLRKEALFINDNGNLTASYNWYGGGHSPTPDRFMDVDGDGDQDVIGKDMHNGIGWYENLGGGQFDPEDMGRDLYPDHDAPRSMDFADMDNDGDIDIALPNSGQFTPFVQDAPCWLPNDGTGHFGDPMLITDTLAYTNWLCTGDINGDGLVDVIVEGGWRPNLGGGVFGAMHATLPAIQYMPTVRDFDNDGDLDVFWAYFAAGTVMINDGTGDFSPLPGVPSLSNSTAYRYTDVDGDGLVDLFAEGYNMGGIPQGIHWFKQTAPLVLTDIPIVEDLFGLMEDMDDSLFILTNCYVMFHASTASFDPVIPLPELAGSNAEFADLNGDGMKDMLFTLSSLGWRERLGPDEFGPFVPFTSPAGLGVDYTTADLDGNGMPDLVARNEDLNAIIWHENISDGSYRMSGTVFVDVDQDGTYDPGEPGLGNIYPVAMDDPSWQALPDTAGHYYLYCNNGTHTAQVELPPYWEATPASHTATTDTITPHVDGLDFALTPVYDTTAFEVWSNFGNLYCLSFWNWYWYETHTTTFGVNNVGTTLPPCRLDLVLSPGLVFSQPSVEPTVLGDTLRWLFNAPYFSESYQVSGYLYDPQQTPDLYAHLMLYAPGSDGADSLIASADWVGQYFCSWDPNDKSVYPEGTGPLHVVDKNIDRLVYTVRFQNTGNAPAYDVMIRDALSADLDAGSVHVLGSSHPLTSVQVENDGEAVFRFNGIQLPDSVSDEPGSHGFVTFSIAPRSDVANETAIENTASIFFDYNDPVITNTTLTTLVDCALFPASITEGDGGLLSATEGEHYQWFFNGDSIPWGNTSTLLAEVTGYYTVRVTNMYGCVNLSEPYGVFIAGVEPASAQGLLVAPNPAQDQVRLFAAEALSANDHVLLIDVHGRVLSTHTGNGTRMLTIDRSGVSDGLYVVRILRDGAQFGAARLVFE